MSDEDVTKQFGLAIRELRRKRGFSQAALAKAVPMSRTYLTGVETGRRNPTLYNIARLAAALGVPIGRLFRVSGHTSADPL
jgi:transcriptional regulator with XRE-family HTH domain